MVLCKKVISISKTGKKARSSIIQQSPSMLTAAVRLSFLFYVRPVATYSQRINKDQSQLTHILF